LVRFSGNKKREFVPKKREENRIRIDGIEIERREFRSVNKKVGKEMNGGVTMLRLK
jgi:hypothetical protein